MLEPLHSPREDGPCKADPASSRLAEQGQPLSPPPPEPTPSTRSLPMVRRSAPVAASRVSQNPEPERWSWAAPTLTPGQQPSAPAPFNSQQPTASASQELSPSTAALPPATREPLTS